MTNNNERVIWAKIHSTSPFVSLHFCFHFIFAQTNGCISIVWEDCCLANGGKFIVFVMYVTSLLVIKAQPHTNMTNYLVAGRVMLLLLLFCWGRKMSEVVAVGGMFMIERHKSFEAIFISVVPVFPTNTVTTLYMMWLKIGVVYFSSNDCWSLCLVG